MNTPVKTNEPTKKFGSFFNYLAALIIIVGVGLFYALKINTVLKWGLVIIAVAAALAIFFGVSPTGLNLHGFLRDVKREVAKVVWPTRKEAVQFTWIVFLFVLILALFLWLVDSSLSWLFYSVILGRGK